MIYSDAKVAQKTHPSLFDNIETLFSYTYCKQYTICQKHYSKMCFLQKVQSTFLPILVLPSKHSSWSRRTEDFLKAS